MTRKEAIKELYSLRNYYAIRQFGGECTEALTFAINSLITDEAYQLEYEKRRVIEIPDNVTNGDVIKALFPDYTYVGTCVLDKYENILLHDVNYNWWNAPYTNEQNIEEITDAIDNFEMED